MPIVEKNGQTYDLPATQLEEAARQGYRVIGKQEAATIERAADPTLHVADTIAAGVEAGTAGFVDAAIAPVKALGAAAAGVQSVVDSTLGAPSASAVRDRQRAVSEGLYAAGVTNDDLRRDVAELAGAGVSTGNPVTDALRTQSGIARWLLSRISGRQVNADLQALGAMPAVGADKARELGDTYNREARQRAIDNPGAAFAGGVAGNVAGALLTGGGATALATAETGLAGRLGLMAADGALGGVGAADESQWLKDGGRAKAEDVLASMGIGAVLGGALGGLGEAGGSLWRRATRGMTSDPGLSLPPEAIEALAGKGAAREAQSLTQPITDRAAKTLVAGAKGVLGLTEEQAAAYERGLTSRAFREVVSDPTAASKRAASELGSDLETIDTITAKSLDTFRELKKPEVEAALSRGGGIEAAEQVRTARALATDAVGEMREAVSTLAARGEKDLARYMRDVPKLTEQRIAAASTPAEAFLALDQTKRELQTLVKGAREKLAGTGLTGSQNREVVDALFGEQGAIQGIQERMRLALEDESVWGAAGAAQRERNAAVSEFLALKKDAEKAFKRDVSSDALAVLEGDPSMRSYVTGRRTTGVIDEDKFAANLLRSGSTEQRFTDEVFDRYVSAAEKLAKVVNEHGTGSVVDADSLLAATQRLQSKRSEYVDGMRAWNALQEANTSAGTSVVRSLADAAPMLGAVIGGPAGAAAGGVLSMLSRGATDPTGTIRAIARLDKLSELVDGRITTGARDLLRSSRSVLPSVNRRDTKRAGARAAGYVAARFARKGQSPSEAYSERAAAIETALADPVQMARDAEGSMGEVARRFPQLSEQLMTTSVGVAEFLRSKMPAPSTEDTVFGGQRVTVSDREADRWGAYWVAATDPLAVLDLARSGQLQREHVEALQACYPDLHARLSAAIVSEVRAGKVPYAARVAADRLLGLDGAGEPSDSPQAQAQRAQAAQAAAAAQETQRRQAPRIDAGAPASQTLWR